MSSDPHPPLAIRARGLGKRYRVAGGPRHDTLRDLLAAPFARASTAGRKSAEEFWALDDVSFDIRRGENVGILGLNGAGKSTLLKVLSRVTVPTRGEAVIEGRLGSLLEVGTGFHPELTGRENVYLYAAILGMGREETRRKLPDILAFAGIDGFVDMPVKRYSSGMYVRLAFSVAAHLEPDVLLLDEVLSVGDLPFQRKCMAFAKALQRRRATILFVSHNMFSIKSMCDRVIYLRRGRVAFDGPVEEGIRAYEADGRLGTVSWAGAEVEGGPVAVTDVEIMDEAGAPRSMFEHGERLRLRFDYAVGGRVRDPGIVVAVIRSDGVACCSFSTELDGVSVSPSPRGGTVELLTPPLNLVAELYRIEILVREEGFQKLLCAQVAGSFHIRHPMLDTHFGVFHAAGEWSCRAEAPVVAEPALLRAAS